MAGVANTPASNNFCAKRKAFISLPIRSGTIGVWVVPILKPALLKPSCIRRVFFQRRSIRSGSARKTWSAFRTPPTTAGASDAVKIMQRARCLRKRIVVRDPARNPPIDPSDLEKVPIMRSTSLFRPK